jgi:hypothetical protein
LKQVLSSPNSRNPFVGPRCDLAGSPLIPLDAHYSAIPPLNLLCPLLCAGGTDMHSVAEYLEKAAEFDELARSTSEPVLKKRYADVAESYRLLAIVWQRLIETGALKLEQR